MLVIQYSYILIELAREYYDFYLVGISSFLVTEIIMTLITVYNRYHSLTLTVTMSELYPLFPDEIKCSKRNNRSFMLPHRLVKKNKKLLLGENSKCFFDHLSQTLAA